MKDFFSSAVGNGSFDFAQDDDTGKAGESAGVPSASAGYAPLAHFYPALSRDPSPRVYSCKARVTIGVNP